jgi:hypothetical protein
MEHFKKIINNSGNTIAVKVLYDSDKKQSLSFLLYGNIENESIMIFNSYLTAWQLTCQKILIVLKLKYAP